MRCWLLWLVLVATPAAAAELRMIGEQFTNAGWTMFEVADLPAGEASITSGPFTTRWPHAGGRIRIPVALAGESTNVVVRVEGVGHGSLDASSTGVSSPFTRPAAYADILGWRPSRPPLQRWLPVIAVAVGFAAIVLCSRCRRRLARLLLLAVPLLLIALGTLWLAFRPNLATRIIEHDGQRLLAVQNLAPTRQTLRVAASPSNPPPKPVAFSPRHLRQLQPTLQCDVRGEPIELVLQLAPGSTVLVRR
jgi:hypothetical protein